MSPLVIRGARGVRGEGRLWWWTSEDYRGLSYRTKDKDDGWTGGSNVQVVNGELESAPEKRTEQLRQSSYLKKHEKQ